VHLGLPYIAAEDIAISAEHLVALARRVVEDRLASAVAAVVVVAATDSRSFLNDKIV